MTLKKEFNGINYLKLKGDQSKNSILIFLPGLGAFKENYLLHLNEFRPLFNSIYAMDLPEQGSKGDWTIGTMVDNLKEFINFVDDSKVKEINLSGHSAGALSILSFIFNYNRKIEIELEAVFQNEDKVLNETLKTHGFGSLFPEMKKVSKLLLYSPPDDFTIIFPKKLCALLGDKNKSTLKKLLNWLVNRPMIFLNYFSRNQYFNFELDKSTRPQYFSLVLNDHKSFLEYIGRYQSVFQLYNQLDKDYKSKISKNLSDKRILIQYGGIDWLLRPFFKRKRLLKGVFVFDPIVKAKRHRGIGHLLNKKMSLDINLNKQMITNLEVISKSKQLIQEL